MLALPVGERAADLTGLRVHQICRVRTRIPAEQGVGQGHVAPPEARKVQPHQQHGQRVDQPLRGVRTQALAEQDAVRQGEVKVAGEQACVQLLPVRGGAPTDDTEGLHTRLVDLLQETQHVVLANGDVGPDLLDRYDLAGDPDESHHVARDAPWKGCQMLVGPVLQRHRPR